MTVTGLAHTFVSGDRRVPVFSDVSFEVRRGEFVCIVGPSGCGKTTLLRILAGLLPPSAGTVSIPASPKQRPFGFVFQSDRLLPWRNVHENVALALESAELDRTSRDERVSEVLALVHLDGFAQFYPHELSGGMRQRVNLARALAPRPAVLLMDEPFAALDAMTRERMQEELMRVSAELETSVVLVTHQIDEAVYLGDRVLVMSARPSKIVDEVRIPFPRPRSVDVKMDDAFFELGRGIWRTLHATTTGAAPPRPA
jgi:NitT/TauT family transport system ATP-binding protein